MWQLTRVELLRGCQGALQVVAVFRDLSVRRQRALVGFQHDRIVLLGLERRLHTRICCLCAILILFDWWCERIDSLGVQRAPVDLAVNVFRSILGWWKLQLLVCCVPRGIGAQLELGLPQLRYIFWYCYGVICSVV